MDTDLITRRDAVATAAALRMVMLECSGLSIGAWLSLVEHMVGDQGVGGSNPLAPIFQSSHFSVNCSDRNRSRHSDFSWGGGGVLRGLTCSAAALYIAALTVSSSGCTYRFVIEISLWPARYASVKGSIFGAQRVKHVWRKQ